jgi:hypothetical protein
MLRGWWARFTGRRNEAAAKRADEVEHMSPAERRFVEEGEEDRRDDADAEAYLGQSDPRELLE